MTQEENTPMPSEGFRLSPQQRRIWKAQDRYGGRGPWTLAVTRVRGRLDVERWRTALGSLHARHEILRTRFVLPAGSSIPLQVIDPPAHPWSFTSSPAAEGSSEASADVDEVLAQIVGRGLETSYDPASDPVLQAEWLQLSAEEALLTLRIPSLACDTLGVRRLVREVWDEYEGSRAARGEAGEEGPLQYADLAEWQNELLETEETEAGRAFWVQYLEAAEDGSQEPRMPFGRQEGGEVLRPRTLRWTLRSDLVEHLGSIAEEAGTDLEVAMASIWQGLLVRLDGLGGRSVGGAFAGRRYAELTEALGPFERYLPALDSVDLRESGNHWLREHGERWNEAREWQEYFDGETGPSFPFLFRFVPDREDERRIDDVRVELSCVRAFSEDFAMILESRPVRGGMIVELHYDGERFLREEAELMAGRYSRLLESLADAPHRAFGELEILPEIERQELLWKPHAVVSEDGPEVGFLERFTHWAETHPERTAVRGGEVSWTYGELQAEASRWAHYWRGVGVGPESTVALCLERSPDLLAALLGVWHAGACYLALDPTMPPRRMAWMLESVGAEWVLTDDDGVVPGQGPRVLRREEIREVLDRQPARPFADSFDPSRLAYVLFTSGSTGRPKGVGVEHRQLAAYLQGVGPRLSLPEGSSYATVTTFAADLGHTSVFSALASGGCLSLIPGDRVADPHLLAEEFRHHPVDCLKIVPSHLSALMTHAAPRDFLPRRVLVLGGEAAPWDLVERLHTLAPGLRVLNHYGPTESTVGVTTYEVSDRGRQDVPWAKTVPVGRPMEHALVRLLDARGEPAPLGTEGEMYVGGDGLARGYLRQPAGTAERFVPDAFSPEPGQRLYRTGDRARKSVAGDLEFLGRVDDQVKIRGFRVEPSEISHLLEEHPGVAAARVLAQTTDSGEAQLVAYVAVDSDQASVMHGWLERFEAGDLRGQALHELPNGMAVAHLNDNETRFLYREIFEDRTYLRHGLCLPEDARIFDVGANIGLFSLWAARLAPKAQIFAFEPISQVARVLRRNAGVYGADRIHVFEHGLSRDEQRREMTHYPHLSMMSSLYADERQEQEVLRAVVGGGEGGEAGSPGSGDGGGDDSLLEELLSHRLVSETVEVRLRRLSQVLQEQNVERIDLLKIDVQKSEMEVLDGIDEEDWPKIRQLVVEVHDFDGRLEDVTRRLESMGYVVHVEQESALVDTQLYDVYARRPGSTPSGVSRETAAAAMESRGWQSPSSLLEDLERSLETRLPAHMIPSATVLLSRLPLTPNGKLDREGLPEPGHGLLRETQSFEPPRNEVEQRLANIWSGVLGHGHFGIRDGFFEVGGHSLLAAQVIARVREEFEASLPLAEFFSHSTIEALGRHIEESRDAEAAADAVETIGRARREAYRRG